MVCPNTMCLFLCPGKYLVYFIAFSQLVRLPSWPRESYYLRIIIIIIFFFFGERRCLFHFVGRMRNLRIILRVQMGFKNRNMGRHNLQTLSWILAGLNGGRGGGGLIMSSCHVIQLLFFGTKVLGRPNTLSTHQVTKEIIKNKKNKKHPTCTHQRSFENKLKLQFLIQSQSLLKFSFKSAFFYFSWYYIMFSQRCRVFSSCYFGGLFCWSQSWVQVFVFQKLFAAQLSSSAADSSLKPLLIITVL